MRSRIHLIVDPDVEAQDRRGVCGKRIPAGRVYYHDADHIIDTATRYRFQPFRGWGNYCKDCLSSAQREGGTWEK